jgi:hypothetical protein
MKQIINAIPSLIFITPQKVDFFHANFNPNLSPWSKQDHGNKVDLTGHKQKCLAARKEVSLKTTEVVSIKDVKCQHN